MAIKNIQMNMLNSSNNYDTLYPETENKNVLNSFKIYFFSFVGNGNKRIIINTPYTFNIMVFLAYQLPGSANNVNFPVYEKYTWKSGSTHSVADGQIVQSLLRASYISQYIIGHQYSSGNGFVDENNILVDINATCSDGDISLFMISSTSDSINKLNNNGTIYNGVVVFIA